MSSTAIRPHPSTSGRILRGIDVDAAPNSRSDELGERGGSVAASAQRARDGAKPAVTNEARVPRPKIRWFALREELPVSRRRAAGVVSFVLCAALYVWASHQPWASETFFPTASVIFETAREIVRDGDFWIDLGYSLLRVTGGFLLAAVLAIPLGVLMGSYRLFEAFLQPPTEFMRYVPVPALVPLVMIFFGIGETAKIVLIFVGTFFQLVIMIADEIRRVPYELVQITQTLGGRRTEIMGRVLFRAALPGIFDALRLCNGWAWTYVVVAELVAASEGLGFRVLRFYRFIQTPNIYVYLLVLGLIGLGLDVGFRRLNARLFAWAETVRR